jgi:hypothetical protein
MANGHILNISSQTHASNAHEPAFNLTADSEWRFDIAPGTWIQPGGACIGNRYSAAGRTWNIFLFDTEPARIRFQIGDSVGAFRATVNHFFTTGGVPADGERVQCRLTLVANNGSNQTVTALYTRRGASIQSLDTDSDWVLESTNTISGAQVWHTMEMPVILMKGQDSSGNWRGKFYGFRWWGSINKTNPILNLDFTNPANSLNAPTYTSWDDAVSADNWSISGGTKGTNWDYVEPTAVGLPQPVISSVTPLSTSALRVAFSTHAEYSDYEIERGGVTVASGVTESPWDDAGLTANTEYSYRVRGRVA